MKKSLIFLIFLILIFIFGAMLGGADYSLKKVESEVYKNFERENFTEVYLDLDNSFNKRLERRVNDISEIIEPNKIKYKFSDRIVVNITEEDLNRLEKDNRIESIKVVGKRMLFLQDSVPKINGSETYQLKVNGLNLTGAGQSICILDSGVNYTHPSLGGCSNNTFLSGGCGKVISGFDYANSDADPMDDNGHGTHIAGIAAGNGTITGVAPGAYIIAIKACDSSGSCSDADIEAGINWCINNRTRYNISVISMSLGSGLNSSFCNSDPLASVIDNAVGKNISVVIATGNGLNNDGVGRANQIAAPACVQNATPVSAVDKSDSIASYANRNSLVMLMAPGTLINSTSWSGGYEINNGTSMSTPHVAGAIAILNQFLNLTAQRVRTPSEIEDVLNDSGKIIIDSASGNVANYSRIRIYDAIISLDNSSPNVSLVSPMNNSISFNFNKTFDCNATDLALSNVSFFLWNSSSTIINQTNRSINGEFYNFQINVINLSEGNYKWNCRYTDKNGNSAFALSNFSFIIGGVSVNLLSPLKSNFTNINSTNFSCEANSESSSSLKNITFNLWNSSALIYNLTSNVSGTSNSSNFNYNFSYEDRFLWNCLAFNNNSNSSFAENNFSIIFDISKPNVSQLNPTDEYSVTGTSDILFEYNVTDNNELSICSLILNTVSSSSNSSGILINQSNNISYSVSSGSYNWRINCTDKAGNFGNSSVRSLIINSPQRSLDNSGSSGGGGSGGGGVNPILNKTLKSNSTTNSSQSSSVSSNNFSNQNNEKDTLNESVKQEVNTSPITGAVIGAIARKHSFLIIIAIVLTLLILILLRMRRIKNKKKNSQRSTEEKNSGYA